MRIALALPLLGLLAACNTTSEPDMRQPAMAVTAAPLTPGAPPTPVILQAIKATAAKSFKDPYSAQWERLQRASRPNTKGEPTDVVCGYVNAKNAYGAYIGAKPFVYFVASNQIHVSGADDTLHIVPALLNRFCAGLL